MNGKTPQKALVTGATGFVGSHLARRLITDCWEVHLIVRPESSLGLIDGILDRVTVHRHDGSTDGVLQIMDQVRPGVVFHLASLFLAQHRSVDVGPLICSNVLFGTQLAEAMAASGVRHFVNTGTSWQHFENKNFSPVNLYAATKEAFEAVLKFYVETASLKVITLKLFDTYGPNDPRPKLFTLLRKVATERQPLVMSPGEQLIDLVYIDDVVDAFMLAAKRLVDGSVRQHECFAVSSGNPIRLKDLVALYSRVSSQTLTIEWGGRPYRPREVKVPWERGEVLPGWRPRTDLEEGIKRMEGLMA